MTKSYKEIKRLKEGSNFQVQESCWDGYKQVGMIKKGDRMVPNCVKEEIVHAVFGKDYIHREPIMEDGMEDMYKGKLNKDQIATIKNTWKNKKASDVTQGVRDMVKKFDTFTRIDLKRANIKYISNLINDEVQQEEFDWISPLQDQIEIVEMNSVVRKTELNEFTTDQINKLAKSYASMSGKTISLANANKLRKMFDRVPDSSLNALRKKKIPFLSGLALSRMIQKKISVTESAYEGDEYAVSIAGIETERQELNEGYEWGVQTFLKKHGYNVSRFSFRKLIVPKSDVEDVKKLLKKETEKVNGDVTVMPNAIIGEAKEEVLEESDAYDNDRFIIIGNTAKKDNSDTPDNKNHVYAPDSKTALQLYKQGKKVYKEELQEGIKIAQLVGKSIAHLEMYVEFAEDIKKQYLYKDLKISSQTYTKAQQVLKSVPKLIKELRKPGIWNEEINEAVKAVKFWEDKQLEEQTGLQTMTAMMKKLATVAGYKRPSSNDGYQAIYDYKNGKGKYQGKGKKTFKQVQDWIDRNGYRFPMSMLKSVLGEEVEIQEADLSKSQVKQVHKQADELPKKDFIKRYGKDGDAIRYATATNQVKKKLGLGENKYKLKGELKMSESYKQRFDSAMGHLGINSLSQLNPEEHKPFFAYVDNLKEGLSAAQKKLPPALQKAIAAKGDKKDEQWGANKASGGKVGDKKKHEDLTPKQKQLDKDKDGDIGADDLAKLRATKKEEAITPFRISYSDKYGKHAGFEDGKSLQDIQNKAQKLRAKGFKIDKPGYPINVGSLDKKLKENLNEKEELQEVKYTIGYEIDSDDSNDDKYTGDDEMSVNASSSRDAAKKFGQEMNKLVKKAGQRSKAILKIGMTSFEDNNRDYNESEINKLDDYANDFIYKGIYDSYLIKKERMGANTPSKQPFNQTEDKKYLQTKPGSLEEAVLKSRGLIK